MKTAAQILRRSVLVVAIAAGVWGCSKEAAEPAVSALAPVTAVDTTAPTLTVTQEVSGPYVPGTTLIVKTTLNYTGTEPVTALALQTKLPQAWQYGGIRGELKPAIDPPKGTAGEATQIWIQIPAFPATVEYALDVPDWTEGTHTLTARAIYRTLGDELKSPVHELSVGGPK